MILDRLFPERKSSPYGGVVGRLLSEWMREGGDGLALTDDQAMRIGAVNACVRLNARVLASLSLHLYRWLPDGRSKERVPLGQNSLVKVLRHPNAWQNGMEFREQLQACVLFYGNGYAWINWTREWLDGALVDRVSELIPIHPSRLEVTQAGWKQAPTYAVLDDQGRKTALPADEVLHVRGTSLSGAVGRGVIGDARGMFEGALEAQRYTGQFWKNDATPGLVVLYDQPLTRERAATERENWDASHAKQARRTAVLSGGVKIDRLSLSNEDSQFLQTREYQAYEIAGLFLTPPHMIGLTTKSTSWGTGIEEQFLGWVTCRLRPDAILWEQAIAQKLIVRDEDYFVEHAFNSLLRGDSQRRSSFYHNAIIDGWMTRNEARALENLNPLKGLDEPLVPLNMAGVDDPPPDPTAPPAGPVPPALPPADAEEAA